MEAAEVIPGACYVAEIPGRDGDTQELVLPLTYLGNRRWKVEQAHTGQIHYVSNDKILCRQTVDNGTTAVAEVLQEI